MVLYLQKRLIMFVLGGSRNLKNRGICIKEHVFVLEKKNHEINFMIFYYKIFLVLTFFKYFCNTFNREFYLYCLTF
jgi:hypothetical protein